MANDHYAPFIVDAFIKPIRSVLIVDDDYPTLDELVTLEIDRKDDGPPPRSDKRWYKNPQRIKKVINGFRKGDRPLLVDVHDGTNVDLKDDANVASHLHQSDLLVLDYELDKSKRGDGGRAIEILRRLMGNAHFNLVVVHTSETMDAVFNNIIYGLLAPTGEAFTIEDRDAARTLIEIREDEDPDVLGTLRGTISEQHYLHSRLNTKTYQRTMGSNQNPYIAFRAVTDAAGWDNGSQKLVLRYLLDEVEAKLRPQMNPTDPGPLEWSDGPVKWIKAESVFIAFSSKEDQDDLIEELQQALEAWSPEPSRLFLAKLRADMDEYGVVAQTQALERRHALAHWYSRLLKADGDERRWLIAESVARHSDQLIEKIIGGVEKFAGAMVEADSRAAGDDVHGRCKDHFRVDLNAPKSASRAKAEHNAFVCSKEPQGWHLTTGHVFEVNGEYWVCLSPACDLVPGQGQERNEGFGERVPFQAVKLHKKGNAQVDVNTNLYIFLMLKGGVEAFCFNSQGKEAVSPISRTFYAESKGVFARDFRFKVTTTRAGKTKLVSTTHAAQVVSQLRYEYALNLMQKLGIAMTRIGLDFV